MVVKRCDSRLIVRVCTEQGGLLSGRRVKVKAENLLQLSRAQQHQIKLPLLTVQLLQRAQKARTLEAQMLGMREQLELMSAEVKRVNDRHMQTMRRTAGKRCSKRRMIWEDYAGETRLSQTLWNLGAKADTFGRNAGWDFSRPDHPRKSKKRLQE